MHKILFILIAFPVVVIGQVENGRKTVARLCSPEFHGRGYVNGGDSIAANYLIKAFQEIGCREFSQGITQDFSFPVNTFPGRMELNINGKQIEPGTAFVVAPNSCSGYETNAILIEIGLNDILNRSIFQSKIDSLSRFSANAKNTIFLFSLYKYAGDTLKKARQLSKTLNERYAIVDVVDTKFTWSVEQEQLAFPRFEVQKSALIQVGKPLTISYAIDARMQDHTARNIISYIPSKRRSKKYIVFTAHYDHLGRMGQATYFPGGNDNASGSAMLVELARYYRNHPLKKTNVVFIAFAGEEVGLLGSQYYVEHPIFPLNSFSTQISWEAAKKVLQL